MAESLPELLRTLADQAGDVMHIRNAGEGPAVQHDSGCSFCELRRWAVAAAVLLDEAAVEPEPDIERILRQYVYAGMVGGAFASGLESAAGSIDAGIVRPLKARIRRLEALERPAAQPLHGARVTLTDRNTGRLVTSVLHDPRVGRATVHPAVGDFRLEITLYRLAEPSLDERLLEQSAKFFAVLDDLDRRSRPGLTIEQANVHRRELQKTWELLLEARAAVLDPDRQGEPIVRARHQPGGDSVGEDT